MTIKFIKTSTLSSACVLPCPLPASPMKLYIPIMDSVLKSGANLTLSGGCSDCNVAIDLFAKLQPFLLSLGIPLCLVRCALALLNTVTDAVGVITDTVGLVTGLADAPPTFPTPGAIGDINHKLQKLTVGFPNGDPPNQGNPPIPGDLLVVIQDCACVYALFTPLGLCLFMRLLRDMLRLVAALLNCFATLMGDILKISFKVTLFYGSLDVRIRQQGVCLGKIARNQLDKLNIQLDLVWLLITGATALFEFVEKACETFAPGMYPDVAKVSVIKAKIAQFQTGSAGQLGGSVDLLIPNCTELKKLALDMKDYLNNTADIIHAVVSVTCPETP